MGVTQGRVSQIERGQARLDTSALAAYLRAIGGELTILATVGTSPCATETNRVRLRESEDPATILTNIPTRLAALLRALRAPVARS